ncbi:MAG TPA: HEAT repeat domain-containing protein [Vicinamibacterales bacterium]
MIPRTPTRPIARLVADLASENAIDREAAVARLTVIGSRAVGRLLPVVETQAAPVARVAALRALEAIGDARGLEAIVRAIDDRDADVSVAAIVAARGFLRGAHGPAALDRLTAAALDRERPDMVRAAAVRAIGELDRATVKPLLAKLADDPSEAVRAAAALRISRKRALDPSAILSDAAERGLPDDPAALRNALVDGGATAALPHLVRIVDRIREREQSVPPVQRPDWINARAAAHGALANRDSRIALYDLKESLEAGTPLPVEFLAALSRIGDTSCLEPIAAAYARANGDPWWRQHLADLFQAIAKRERVTVRHAAMKRIAKRWPEIVESR